jgi:hydroxymethylpyrimidine pyrophosphatase-like HAD family hydrolase
MAIRLLAVDLDGTLLNSRSEISPANLRALEEAFRRGVQIAIVTGRRRFSANPFVAQIRCAVTLVTSNGALVGSAAGEILDRHFLPKGAALEALEVARPFRPYTVAIFDRAFRGQVTMQEGASTDGPYGWYLAHAPEALELVPDLERAVSTDPVQLMIGGPPAVVRPAEPLLAHSPAGPKIHLSWTQYFSRNMSLLDVNAHGCSKASAVARLAREAGILPSEVMAVGDNFNDLELLRYAGRPVVMSQAPPGLRAEGWALTSSNDADGVAEAIQAYILNDGLP